MSSTISLGIVKQPFLQYTISTKCSALKKSVEASSWRSTIYSDMCICICIPAFLYKLY